MLGWQHGHPGNGAPNKKEVMAKTSICPAGGLGNSAIINGVDSQLRVHHGSFFSRNSEALTLPVNGSRRSLKGNPRTVGRPWSDMLSRAPVRELSIRHKIFSLRLATVAAVDLQAYSQPVRGPARTVIGSLRVDLWPSSVRHARAFQQHT